MKRENYSIALLTAIFILVSVGDVKSQVLEKQLAPFEQFIGKTWVGHFVASSDSELEHRIRWEVALNGKVVKETKEVPALDFMAETHYYWDWEKSEISFISFTSRGIFSRGNASFEDGTIIRIGSTVRSDSVSPYKQTFEILADGKLRDQFYQQEKASWVRGHLIEYVLKSSNSE